MDLISHLKERLLSPLPGEKAHLRMMHPYKAILPRKPGPSSRQAAVLLLLFPMADTLHTVFIRRKLFSGVNAHRGQIGLPGGKMEPADKDLQDTALRESEEEIGVLPTQVNVLGQLSRLFIPVSDFEVYPFVGYSDQTPFFIPQESEVDEIIPVELNALRHPEALKIKHIETPTGLLLKDVPYFDLEGRVLWGATAMIVSEFLEILDGLPVQRKVRGNA